MCSKIPHKTCDRCQGNSCGSLCVFETDKLINLMNMFFFQLQKLNSGNKVTCLQNKREQLYPVAFLFSAREMRDFCDEHNALVLIFPQKSAGFRMPNSYRCTIVAGNSNTYNRRKLLQTHRFVQIAHCLHPIALANSKKIQEATTGDRMTGNPTKCVLPMARPALPGELGLSVLPLLDALGETAGEHDPEDLRGNNRI